MPKLIISTCCLVFMASFMSVAVAQQPSQPAAPQSADSAAAALAAADPDVALFRGDLRTQRRKIVAANVPLTAEEASRFWPIYDQYEAEYIKINDGRYTLLKEYADSYQTMTDDQADNFIKRWLAFDDEDTQLRMRYIPEFQKAISHRKTAMFFEVDRRVGMMVNLKLAGKVPLVNP